MIAARFELALNEVLRAVPQLARTSEAVTRTTPLLTMDRVPSILRKGITRLHAVTVVEYPPTCAHLNEVTVELVGKVTGPRTLGCTTALHTSPASYQINDSIPTDTFR